MLNSITQTNWRMQFTSTVWFHFPAGRCACSDGKVGSREDWIAIKCSEFIDKGEWPSKLLDVNLLAHHIWELRLNTTRHFIPSQRRLMYWGKSCSAALNQQSHIKLHKNTSSLCERWDRHLERALRKTVWWRWTLNTTSDCPFLGCNSETQNKILQKL